MGVGSGVKGLWPPWIFIHSTDKVERGLMVLFFGLVFPIGPPEKFSADTLGSDVFQNFKVVTHRGTGK